MKLEQNSPWDTFEAIEPLINSDEIKSWLLEKGPITKRIKAIGTFKLELIQDKVTEVEKSEILFLNSNKILHMIKNHLYYQYRLINHN